MSSTLLLGSSKNSQLTLCEYPLCFCNTQLFGQIVSQHQVKELELTFTHGRWNYDQYPFPPPIMGEQGLKVSAELLEDESEENLRERWSRVKSALAGAFCNSLNLLDEKHTVEDAPPHFYGGKTFLEEERRSETDSGGCSP